MLPRSVAVLPCHLGWRTLLKCNKTIDFTQEDGSIKDG
jgi:hypothetical protein